MSKQFAKFHQFNVLPNKNIYKKKIKVAFQATKKQIEILLISQVFLKTSTDNSKTFVA